MLSKTIEINKKLLPSIQKQKLDKEIKMRIMKRVGELKKELDQMNDPGIKTGGTSGSTSRTSRYFFLKIHVFII